MVFVFVCIVAHFAVVFFCDIWDDEQDAMRFHLIHGLLLFQWMLALCFLLTWYQNYRFEYAIEHLLNEGHSLFYLLNDRNSKLKADDNLERIQQEIKTLAMSPKSISNNDVLLTNQYFNEKTSKAQSFRIIKEHHNEHGDERYSDVSDPDYLELNQLNEFNGVDPVEAAHRRIQTLSQGAFAAEMEMNENRCTSSCSWLCSGCGCIRCLGVTVLKMVRFLPHICLLNGILNGYFGLFVCNLEIIWLQHAITVAVTGCHLIFVLCMNEKQLILQKETGIMRGPRNSINEDIHQKVKFVKTDSNKWRPKKKIKSKKGMSVVDEVEADEEDGVFVV